jgi:hypothetical protein
MLLKIVHMNFPQIYNLQYSKKYLQFFYICCGVTLCVIWVLLENSVATILSVILILYSIYATRIIKASIHKIVLNKENIWIDEQKIVQFQVIFSNNIWAQIRYTPKHSKSMNLLIFKDSCPHESIYTINKYLNFATKIL